MSEIGLDIVKTRNSFYRDSYKRVTFIFLLSLSSTILLCFLLFYLVTHPPKPRYFPVDENGRMTELIPLDQPSMSDADLLLWASQAATASYSYNFVNYRQELQAASEFYTPNGWQAFLDALAASNNLLAVKSRKLIVSAVPTAAPVLLQKGLYNGVFSWQIQMPMNVTFQNSTQITNQLVKVTLLIVRIPSLNSAKGIGIDQFVVGSSGEESS